ncbi:hypothetical protein [Streptomyces sp. NPDC059008]|uniref:hypothetical protein n=1 Tax=Streptomyces sp. NPDC059008 TaxID=3346693 RepID=UPI003697A355
MLKSKSTRLVGLAAAFLVLVATGLIAAVPTAAIEGTGVPVGQDSQAGIRVTGESVKRKTFGVEAMSNPEAEPKTGILADSGFRPQKNGFSFDNYGAMVGGKNAANLSKVEMRKLFGNGVCRGGRARGCRLTRQAHKWMNEINKGLDGGHCYGFSVTSLLMWKGRRLKSASFGSEKVSSLKIEGNIPLQRQLAYSSASEDSTKVAAGRITGTPNAILDKLIAVLKPSAPEAYSLGFFKRDYTGGHEVTPYAVKYNGGGKYDVLIYDNNYNRQTRVMKFNRTKNSWSYNARISPEAEVELYEGDASDKTLSLDPASPSVQQSRAPFAVDGVSAHSDSKAKVSLKGSLDEQAHSLPVDGRGHPISIVGAKAVNEIIGAEVHPFPPRQPRSTRLPSPSAPPAGIRFTLTMGDRCIKSSARAGVEASTGFVHFRAVPQNGPVTFTPRRAR